MARCSTRARARDFGETEPGVDDAPFALDRRLRHVERAAAVDGDVARRRSGGRSTGRSELRTHERRLHERAVRTRDDAQLTGSGVGAGHRDADREAAAPVGVHAERAVLVPRHVGDALDDADRLHERLDAVAVLSRQVVVVGEPADAQEAVAREQLADVVGECSLERDCMRTQRSSPSAVLAHHERPSSRAYVGRARSMSAEIASIVVGSNQPRRCRNPASARKCAMSSSSSSGVNARWRSSGDAVAIAEVDGAARVRRTRVDQRAQHDPPVEEVAEVAARHVAAVPPVRKVIGVFRSLTTSAMSSSESSTIAAPSAPGVDA